MTKQTEAMKLALEALSMTESDCGSRAWEREQEAITALREALAEQPAQQEPKQSDIFCGVDFADGMLSVSVLRRRADDVAELLHAEQIELLPQRKPLTDEQVNLFINGRGDEDDDDYVEPTGDGFGLTDADLVRLVRRVEAAHGIKE